MLGEALLDEIKDEKLFEKILIFLYGWEATQIVINQVTTAPDPPVISY